MSKKTFLLLLIVFTEGIFTFYLELSAHILFAPEIGQSFFVWSVILSFTMLGLSGGYLYGNKLANQIETTEKVTVRILLLIAVLVPLMAVIINYLNTNDVITSPVARTLVYSTLYILIPVFFTGCIPPLVIRLMMNENNAPEGEKSGLVFSVSTVGSLLSGIVFGLWLIPAAGIVNTMAVSLVILLSVSFLLSKSILRFSAVAVVSLLLFTLSSFSGEQQKMSTQVKVLYESDGILGNIKVVDFVNVNRSMPSEERILLVNNVGQTWVNRFTGKTRWEYVHRITELCGTKKLNREVLLLGLGGGSIAADLEEKYNSNVDAVEIDSRMKEIASEFFYPELKCSVIIDDARHYINVNEKKYDIIISDIYLSEIFPAHVFTLESLKKLRLSLNDEGLFFINFYGTVPGEENHLIRSLIKTMQASGFFTFVIESGLNRELQNTIIMASLSMSAENYFVEGTFDQWKAKLFLPEEFKNEKIFTDDLPGSEWQMIYNGMKWRKEYELLFDSEYKKLK